MRSRWGWGLVGLVATLAAAPASANCAVQRLAALPVTMAGARATVPVKFGTHEARFVLDSGAFYSTISRAGATEFALTTVAAPFWFRVSGVGGEATVELGRANDFSLAGIHIPHADFIVGGSDIAAGGMIGQDVLGIADVEYDLPHGAVRLMKTSGCDKAALAYWAGDRPYSMVALDREASSNPLDRHTVAVVLVNGVKVRAGFDTGAATSLLSLAAARRAGVTPTSPGVVLNGASGGIGSRQITTWLAPFDSVNIGGEIINHPKIRVADVELGGMDMLIGADFFLTHRLFVANGTHRLFFTYEGGPVFGLDPKGARTDTGRELDLTDKAAAPTDAAGFSRRGAVYAANGKFDLALADFDQALKLAPGTARYLIQRAGVRVHQQQPALATADLDAAIAAAPEDAEARLARATLRLVAKDHAGAAVDLAEADRVLPPFSEYRLRAADLHSALDDQEGALADYSAWLKLHGADGDRPGALNGRCWALGLLDRELDRALDDCNAALRLRPGDPATLDSRALVELRRGKLDAALADYNTVLKIAPKMAWSRYARGLVEARTGNAAAAATDRAAALALDAAVAERAAKYRISG